MPCNYSYPSGNTVKKTFWFIQWPSDPDPIDLTQDPNYSQRVNYLGDDQHNCTFSIRNLTETDSTLYRFRFITSTSKWASKSGVTLSVTGLQVTVNQNNVTEGQNVMLTCRTNCSLSDPPTFIWYKNGNPTPNTNPVSSVLYLLSVSNSPKNTSVSVSPSGDIVEGSSVTLTCSSKANPPVYRYTWFKKKVTEISQKGSGQSYTITNITSEDSGQYYCNSENTYGAKNSSQVDVNVRYAPKNVSVSINPSGEILEGSSVTLTCNSKANPPVDTYTWFKNGAEILQNYNITNITIVNSSTGEVYIIPIIISDNSGQYYCMVKNKNTSISVSPFEEIMEGSSVTLTCSSKANPPVDTYTWFRKIGGEILKKGSGQNYTISNITSVEGGEYYCEAMTRLGVHNSTSVIIIVGTPTFVIPSFIIGIVIGSTIAFIFVIVYMGSKIFRSLKKTERDE
ncbi:B-cell receptor CD22-like, partial [Scleropages formosus]